MSEEKQPFNLDDVEFAHFAHIIRQEADAEDESPQQCIRRKWPPPPPGTDELLGQKPLLPQLLARYERGAAILEQAELVHTKAIWGDVTPAHYDQLGQTDSPVWLEDEGYQLNGQRKSHLWALRRK